MIPKKLKGTVVRPGGGLPQSRALDRSGIHVRMPSCLLASYLNLPFSITCAYQMKGWGLDLSLRAY